MELLQKSLITVCLLANVPSVFAEVTISHAWLRLLPPTLTTTAAYMDMTSDIDDTLLEVSSPMAASVKLHQSSMSDGMMSMTPVEALRLPKGVKVALSPQGYHLMVMGLKEPLMKGKIYSMHLHFEKAGDIEVQVPVEAR